MFFGRKSLRKWIGHTKHTNDHHGVAAQNGDLERLGSYIWALPKFNKVVISTLYYLSNPCPVRELFFNPQGRTFVRLGPERSELTPQRLPYLLG